MTKNVCSTCMIKKNKRIVSYYVKEGCTISIGITEIHFLK